MKIAQWLLQATGRLQQAHVASPSLDAQLLAAHVLLVDRSFVLSHPDHEFPELAGEQLLQRREGHEPLAYILGCREFYGRRFKVAPGVLIPRQETETLVEAALDSIRYHAPLAGGGEAALGSPGLAVLDLGTGSGCIAITIKLEAPSTVVEAADVSANALDVGRQNAQDLAADVDFFLSDGLRDLDGRTYDLIVCNPPYVGLDEELPAEIHDFEPHEALFSGPTGLEFYETLAQTAAAHMRGGAFLMVEVGYRQSRDVSLLFEASGWNVVEVRKDLSGIERVVIVEPLFAGKTPQRRGQTHRS